MSYDPAKHQGRLRRLSPGHYQGLAWVHWTMTTENRAQGWLEQLHHARVREALCHALAREALVCATYCLMPDHAHFLIGGLSPESDQRPAIREFRRVWNGILKRASPAAKLDLQAYDHVLRDEERGRDAFERIRGYILENPVRSKLCDDYRSWPYSGTLVVGYADLDPREEEFPIRFWRLYHHLLKKHEARNP